MFGHLLFGSADTWTPLLLNPRGIWIAGNYSLSGAGGAGLWNPSNYLGAGSGIMQGTSIASPTVDNVYGPGAVAFDISAGQSLTLAGGQSVTNICGAAKTCTFFAALKIASITGSSSTTWSNNMVIGDSFGSTGIYLGQPGSHSAIMLWYDGADRHANVSLGSAPISGVFTIVGRNQNGQLDITIDGTNFVSGAATGNLSSPGILQFGAVAVGGLGYNGSAACLGADNVAWSDADVARFFKWSHRVFGT